MNENKELVEDEILEEEITDTQEAFDVLSLNEEIKRLENQAKPLEVPEVVITSDIYNEIMTQAYTLASGIRVLVDSGVDYSNSVSIINNFMMNYDSKEQVKVQVQQLA